MEADKKDFDIYVGTRENSTDKNCFAIFFAANIASAKKMAREMKLKDFRQVCNKHYEKGIDY